MINTSGLIFTVFLLCSLAFILWLYLFDVYEVRSSYTIDVDGFYRIEAIPLNAFGKRAPFKKCECEFSIIEGKEFIRIVEEDIEKGEIVFEPLEGGREILIKAKPKLSLWRSQIKIQLIKKEES